MKIFRYSVFILLLFLFFGMSCRRDRFPTSHYSSAEGLVWNTQYHFTFAGPENLADSARVLLADLGHTLSVFDTTSMVSIVNRQDSTPINADFIRVYSMSKRINKMSEGAFDPTLTPLITAWGFGPGHSITPDTASIDSIMNFVGIRKTHLRNDALIKDDSRIQFNFSAIAKGYGCDRVGDMMKANGVTDYLIEIGGEIRAEGVNPSGGKWRISIDRPVFGDSAVIHESQVVIAFTDMGLATSGNYRNYHKEGDNILGHTISGITGRPLSTSVLSATVLAPSAMEADGLATALMAMPDHQAILFAKRLRMPVMLIQKDTVWTSPEFRKLIVPDI